MRKFKEVKRKEIIYSLSEWKQIEKAAAKVSMQTSEYIRRMSLNGHMRTLKLHEKTEKAREVSYDWSWHRKQINQPKFRG